MSGSGRLRSTEGRPIKVLLVVPWDQEFGGVASVVGNIGRQLERAGHEVIFLHPGEAETPRRRRTAWGFDGFELKLRSPFIPELPVRSLAAFLFFLPATLVRLGGLIRRERVDIVNIHYPIGQFVYLALLRVALRFRLVVSVHGADLFPGGRRQAIYSQGLLMLLRRADAVVAPSRAFLGDTRSVVPRLGSRGLSVHNGVDFDESTNGKLTNAFLYTGDDGMATKNEEASGTVNTKNIVHEHIVVYNNSVGGKIGTKSMGQTMDGVVFRDMDVVKAGRAMTIEAYDTAVVSNTTYEDIRVEAADSMLINIALDQPPD